MSISTVCWYANHCTQQTVERGCLPKLKLSQKLQEDNTHIHCVLSIKSKQREGRIKYRAESGINTIYHVFKDPISVPEANRTSLTIFWRVFDKEARLLCRWSSAVIGVVKEKLFSGLEC